MTDRELMQQALEAMEHLNRTGDTQVFDLCYAPELIPALKERLAREEQEPVKESSVTHSHLWVSDLYGKEKNA